MSEEMINRMYEMIVDAYKKEDKAASKRCEKMANYYYGRAEAFGDALAMLAGITRKEIDAKVIEILNS